MIIELIRIKIYFYSISHGLYKYKNIKKNMPLPNMGREYVNHLFVYDHILSLN